MKTAETRLSRKKPWNRVSTPVYSISSRDTAGNANMNIITYALPVSLTPNRFIIAVYRPSLTLEILRDQPRFVLQLLGEDQYRLTNLLGMHSGRITDKIGRLAKRKLLGEWKGFAVLKDCLAVMEMTITSELETDGDHAIFHCQVNQFSNQREGQPLTLDTLRTHKMIRI